VWWHRPHKMPSNKPLKIQICPLTKHLTRRRRSQPLKYVFLNKPCQYVATKIWIQYTVCRTDSPGRVSATSIIGYAVFQTFPSPQDVPSFWWNVGEGTIHGHFQLAPQGSKGQAKDCRLWSTPYRSCPNRKCQRFNNIYCPQTEKSPSIDLS